nr:TonB family protein [uncultured Rhodoferax sp.]
MNQAAAAVRSRVAFIALMMVSVQVLAQEALVPATPAAQGSAAMPRIGDPDYGKSERSLKAAHSPLRWIKLHAEGARSPAPALEKERDKDAPALVAAKPRVLAAKPAAAKTHTTVPAATAVTPAASAPEPSRSTEAAAPAASSLAGEDLPDLVLAERSEPAWDTATMTELRSGRVEVRFDVGIDGRTAAARVVNSSNKVLDKVALDTIRTWRFERISRPRSAAVEFGFDLDDGRTATPAAAPAAIELSAIEQPDPYWGEALMQRLRKGQAHVRITIGADGLLAGHEVLSVSNPALLDPIAATLKRWRFHPLEKPLVATVEFGFDLDRTAR